jgi:RHH-type proline utilization regulon transcriptional repressor/proline dehydrogenase/delta 1-pyrroline-5-carboxylate dehydrogenase
MDGPGRRRPDRPATDVGPVIDAEAKAALEAHVARLSNEAKIIACTPCPPRQRARSSPRPSPRSRPPTSWSARCSARPARRRYEPEGPGRGRRQALAARGYGLTLGVHSRIEAFAAEVQRLVPAGNVYVNRSITGAVVGVQPFGGEGLSGTGPKAGGPHALLATRRRYARGRRRHPRGSLSWNSTSPPRAATRRC